MELETLRAQIESLPRDDPRREQALDQIAQLAKLYRDDPLSRFHCCPQHCGVPFCKPHPKQFEFGSAHTRLSAVFSGNRFGKTAIGTVRSVVNCMNEEDVPERLRPLRFVKHLPAKGRIVGPDLNAWMNGVLMPELRKWTPPRVLRDNSFDKAWNKHTRVLRFKNESWLQVMTYEMDVDKFGGAALDFVWFDEPPPYDIYDECSARIGTQNGLRMFFTMTPLNMEGASAAWVYRDIWKQREAPHITVVKGSTGDNPHLSSEEIEAVFEGRAPDDPRRRAREHGDFSFWGGLVYPGGFEEHLVAPPSPERLRGRDIVVGIDPGLRNAAFIWVAFDSDNEALVFDEVLIQNGVPAQFARALKLVNRKWGIKDPRYVIDPSAKNRSQTDSQDSVESLLMLHGIFSAHANNQVEAGVQNVRDRLADGALKISTDCYGLRDEADEYHSEQLPTGEFKPVKQNDHRLDALRYALMSRIWTPMKTQQQARRRLGFPKRGFDPDHADPMQTHTEEIYGEVA
jgi:phage terminase large subunit-like protein